MISCPTSRCQHDRQRHQCKKCGGSSICLHNRVKSHCKECGGSQICEHDRQRSRCKECGGSSICQHGRIKYECKPCGGSGICEHGRQRCRCKECGGSSFCFHNRRKSNCKECGGGSICEHSRSRSQCKECGGSSFCEHERQRSRCKECGGGSRCNPHNKRDCPECKPLHHLANVVRKRVRRALKSNKSKRSHEYLGCTIEKYRSYIEEQFIEGMTWENHGQGEGKWNIDHITPIMYLENGNPPTLEVVTSRLHYSNTQPMWALENISKGNRFVG